jgi:hypothetical protein
MKRNLSFRKDLMESKSEKVEIRGRSITQRYMKDFYQTNPLEPITKQGFTEKMKEFRVQNKVKCDRVEGYLSSTGIKSIFNMSNKKTSNISDKIVNKEYTHIKNPDPGQKPFNLKRHNIQVDGKKGTYMN